MAKKSSKRTLEAPDDGDLPWFLIVEEDEWHEIEIDLSVGIEKAKTEEKGWSCYLIEFTDQETGETFEAAEVPFWAMKAFFKAVQDDYNNGNATTQLKYKRTSDGKINKATFREA